MAKVPCKACRSILEIGNDTEEIVCPNCEKQWRINRKGGGILLQPASLRTGPSGVASDEKRSKIRSRLKNLKKKSFGADQEDNGGEDSGSTWVPGL
ncbi:MAG: hypothetical protein ACLFQV_00540 [Vulcanimicrobiota bacterium]